MTPIALASAWSASTISRSAAVDQRGVELLGVQTQFARHIQEQRLARAAEVVGAGEEGLDVRPALALVRGLLGGLGGGVGVLVLLQREVPQPDLDTVPVPGAQGAHIVEGAVAVGAFEIAPEVEDDRCRRGGIAHVPSLPGRTGASQPGPAHPLGRSPALKCP